MKKYLLPLLFITLCLSSRAQHPFSKGFGYLGILSGLENTIDSGFVVTTDNLFAKFDKDGNCVWGKSLNLADGKICKTNDSCYFLAGTPSSGNSIICIKFNELGDTIWTRSIVLPGSAFVSKIIQLSDSNFVLIGQQRYSAPPYSKMFIAKLDTAGNFLWKKNYTGGNYQNKLTGIVESSDHNFYACGAFENYTTTFSLAGVLLKFSASGDMLWNTSFPDTTNYSFFPNDLCLLPGGLLFGINYHQDLIFGKADWDGNLLWTKKSTSISSLGGYQDFVPGFKKKNPNDIFFDSKEGCISELDSSGNILGTFCTYWGLAVENFQLTLNNGIAHSAMGFGGTFLVSDDSAFSSTCLLPGSPYNTIPTTLITDSLVFAVDSDGVQSHPPISISNTTLVGYDACPDIEFVPEYSHLDHINMYPNPSSNEFNFAFTDNIIPETICVYDLNGRLLFQFNPTNSFEQVKLPSDVSSGVYSCRFQFSDVRVTKELIVIK